MDLLPNNAPRWLQALLPALSAVAFVALPLWGYWYFVGTTAIEGVIGGLLLLVALNVSVGRPSQQVYMQAAQLPMEKYDEARRAARKGPVPTDPQIRHAAIRLVRFELELLKRRRVPIVIVVGVLLVVSLVFAVFALPVAALVGGYLLAQPALLRQRLGHLQKENVRRGH